MESSDQTTSSTREGVLEAQDKDEYSKRGGWITFPFIIGNLAGLSVAAGGWGSNWIVFLITKFNIGSIAATKINNVGFGFVNLFPIAGAIVADSFAGNFAVVGVSSFVALLGMIMLTLIAGIHSLRPSPCSISSSTTPCESPTKLQYLFLYAAMGLTSLGIGGSRFTIATMGADQFERTDHQATFFNWYFVVLYVGNATSFFSIVYIEDNVGWGLGFGICLVATAIGLALFLLGKRFYRHVKPKGSPFVSIARVVVAAIKKRKMSSTESFMESSANYYFGSGNSKIVRTKSPSKNFRFLNIAALKTENDKQVDGIYSKSWKLCTVEEVEDLKKVIKIIPLWSTGILLSITIAMVNSLSTVQALTMDRHLGSMKIPAATFLVSSLMSTAISIFIIDRLLLPTWQKIFRRSLTPLQRIGVGHIINVLGLVVSALIEARRLHLARTDGLVTAYRSDSVVPMSALWLVASLAVMGMGEAFQFPGQVALYYQEFPESLKSTSTAMISLLIGLGYYLSAVVTDLIDRATGWLPNNINEGRVDNVFWLCTVIGVVKYLVCARMYKYQHDQNIADND
ncbi:Proton-dependent oligopeptide transporter [Parasponia andersonii]|uniref:Proton-dependent oligopeptide transporter n=1 Tax=Parasponia andersonii TaxID=3476 RepID=A0A2P5B6I8_PARAD|nr:Proton-dependent oligopeptide transporter [Parasponia andersonii]